MTMLRPLISAKVRSTARRSAPWKSRLIGWPVYCFAPETDAARVTGADCPCAAAGAATGALGAGGATGPGAAGFSTGAATAAEADAIGALGAGGFVVSTAG